jgi:hypothetical protein
MAIREPSDGTYGTYGIPGDYWKIAPYRSHKPHRINNRTVTGARRESWGELIGELASQSVGLMRDEVALARSEF